MEISVIYLVVTSYVHFLNAALQKIVCYQLDFVNVDMSDVNSRTICLYMLVQNPGERNIRLKCWQSY